MDLKKHKDELRAKIEAFFSSHTRNTDLGALLLECSFDYALFMKLFKCLFEFQNAFSLELIVAFWPFFPVLVSSDIPLAGAGPMNRFCRNEGAFDLSGRLRLYVSEASAFMEALLSKKPPHSREACSSRTQMHVPSSQLATPSSAPSLKPMSPPADTSKPFPSPNE
ncbi:hypothetical protein Tco_0896395 [Tanacetum coccineum]